MTLSPTEPQPTRPAELSPDDGLYNVLDETELTFFSEQTGIKDRDELKKHISEIRNEAWKVHPYHCIRVFAFARLKVNRFPAYKDLLRLGKERPGALFLDLGCCLGHDVRRAVADGFPISQAIGSDLHPDYWDLGHKLFKTTPETYPLAFIPADVFDPASLAPAPLPTSVPTDPLPPLTSLTSLNPLHGRLSVIHASAFFHLFTEEKQLELAKLVAPLLSPEPGSFIFGAHGGLAVKGNRERVNSHGIHMFCHSPESWKELWEKQVFPEGQVKVDAFLLDRKIWRPESGERQEPALVWTVTRL